MASPFRAAFDGGSRGNPGPAAWGVALFEGDWEYVEGFGGTLGHATNNVAEYNGLLHALRIALERGATDVALRADSELIVKQLNGEYRVKHADLKPLYAEAQAMIARLATFRIEHVQREENKQADRMVNAALDRAGAGEIEARVHDTDRG